MKQYKRIKNISSLFLTLFILLFFSSKLSAQITLLKTDSIKCLSNDYNFEPIFEQKFTNDSILQIKTTALANCMGVNNPRIKLRGPLLNLEFDQFIFDERINPETNKVRGIVVADCNCVYKIIWYIKGIKETDKFIVLLHGQISKDFKKSHLDSLLTDYEIDNSRYHFHLINAIDKNRQKQGDHLNWNNNQTKWEKYTNGIIQNENDK